MSQRWMLKYSGSTYLFTPLPLSAMAGLFALLSWFAARQCNTEQQMSLFLQVK